MVLFQSCPVPPFGASADGGLEFWISATLLLLRYHCCNSIPVARMQKQARVGLPAGIIASPLG